MDDIKHYSGSVGSEVNILALLNKLVQTSCPTESLLTEEAMWQKTQASFLTRLETQYPHYMDLVTPLSFSIHQVNTVS